MVIPKCRLADPILLILILSITACGTLKQGSAAPVPPTTSPPTGVHAELSSPQTIDGSIILVSVQLPPELQKNPLVGEFEEIELPFFPADENKPGTYEAILGVPYSHKPGPSQISIRIGQGDQSKTFVVPVTVTEGNYPSETLHVNPRRVHPKKKKDLERIKREVEEVAQIYSQVTQKKYWSGPFELPIKSKVTSGFGTKRIYNGELQNFHPGLDLKAKMKTPIRSAESGIVVLAKNLFYTGNTVMIDHGYGLITLYAHMSKLKVKKGQVVKKGTLLGLSGMSGRVTGPHLHWQAVVHKVKFNPMDLTTVVR